jgi:tRNA-splicing ligase RtcB
MKVISDTRFPIKVWTSEVEETAEQQLRNLASLPFIHKHVAVMPDVHAGKGSTIGTVIATTGAILPSAVGVDLGCGMCAVRLPIKASDIKDLPKLRHSLERSIPTGRFGNAEVNSRVAEALKAIEERHGKTIAVLPDSKEMKNALAQCGSLGSGNHFIEVCEDTEGIAWIMLHSGSRNIGKVLAEKHIDKAKGLMKQYFIELADPDLAFFAEKTPEFQEYIHDMYWAQHYAKANRNEMMLRALKDVSFHVFGEDRGPEFMTTFRVDCHHNYCQRENHFGKNVWVTRKGAVSAREGEFGIIPGSMGAKSFIVKGKGNPESFNSCSHGAGRKMSRKKARDLFRPADLEAQTAGVECRKDNGIVDEIPAAYKDIDQVMANQADLVEVAYQLKQILCIKGD